MEMMRNRRDSCEHQKNISTNFCDNVAITLSRPTNLTSNSNQVAEVVIEVLREEVKDETRLVNSEIILNEWSYENLRHNQLKLVTYQFNKVILKAWQILCDMR
ncbi:hypothetical protein AAHE18_02G054000 [Arachis hypogaea]|nr:uncharacterized protein DS421_2g40790 [Arachis hypogaea]